MSFHDGRGGELSAVGGQRNESRSEVHAGNLTLQLILGGCTVETHPIYI